MIAHGQGSELSKYTPVYLPVNTHEPTEQEKRIDGTLQEFMAREMPLESDEEMFRRDLVLEEVRKIFIKWVQFIANDVVKIPVDEEDEVGGEIFLSGSHRLGVRDIGADIDTVCVAPNFCTREHFFTYLKNDLKNHSDVTELNAIEDAFVPVISFDFKGVSIDLLFARLSDSSVPKDLNILDDGILAGLDEATEKSLNGPRVTNMLFKLVGEKTFPNFLIVLRCIRKWAKKRGLYGNKLGYLGGVNFNILVAFACQLYPNSGPSSLLYRFFKIFSTWKWPDPIVLNVIQHNPVDTPIREQREVWSPVLYPNHLMPIITPAFPAMNSAVNVSVHTLEVMKRELVRGCNIIKQIIEENGKGWDRLFEPTDFFLQYSHYLACHLIGRDEDSESIGWIGFVESRLRRFIPMIERLPIKLPIQLLPLMSKTQRSKNSICYFIGFNLNLEMMEAVNDKNVYLDECINRFQDTLWDPERGYKGERVEGLDFVVEHLTWRKLPKEVFEPFGGKEAAKKLRIDRGYVPDPLKKVEKVDDKLSAVQETEGEVDQSNLDQSRLKDGPDGGVNAEDNDIADGTKVDATAINATAQSLKKRKLSDVSVEDSKWNAMQMMLSYEQLMTQIPVLTTDGLAKKSNKVFSVPNVTWSLLENK